MAPGRSRLRGLRRYRRGPRGAGLGLPGRGAHAPGGREPLLGLPGGRALRAGPARGGRALVHGGRVGPGGGPDGPGGGPVPEPEAHRRLAHGHPALPGGGRGLRHGQRGRGPDPPGKHRGPPPAELPAAGLLEGDRPEGGRGPGPGHGRRPDPGSPFHLQLRQGGVGGGPPRPLHEPGRAPPPAAGRRRVRQGGGHPGPARQRGEVPGGGGDAQRGPGPDGRHGRAYLLQPAPGGNGGVPSRRDAGQALFGLRLRGVPPLSGVHGHPPAPRGLGVLRRRPAAPGRVRPGIADLPGLGARRPGGDHRAGHPGDGHLRRQAGGAGTGTPPGRAGTEEQGAGDAALRGVPRPAQPAGEHPGLQPAPGQVAGGAAQDPGGGRVPGGLRRRRRAPPAGADALLAGVHPRLRHPHGRHHQRPAHPLAGRAHGAARRAPGHERGAGLLREDPGLPVRERGGDPPGGGPSALRRRRGPGHPDRGQPPGQRRQVPPRGTPAAGARLRPGGG